MYSAGASVAKEFDLPFASLHRGHGGLDVAIITIDLLLVFFLALIQVIQSFGHAIDLLLALETHPVLGTNVICDGVQDALISILASDLAQLLQLEQEKYSMRFDFTER